MKTKDYWFLAFVRCSNEYVLEKSVRRTKRAVGRRAGTNPPSVHVRVFYSL